MFGPPEVYEKGGLVSIHVAREQSAELLRALREAGHQADIGEGDLNVPYSQTGETGGVDVIEFKDGTTKKQAELFLRARRRDAAK